MLRIGLTGGIGSGKSLVAAVFRNLGIPVFEADKEARFLTDNDPDLKREISRIFGVGMYDGGSLRRKELAEIVFREPGRLDELNRLVHPRVIARFNKWAGGLTGAPYLVHEAAILIESGMAGEFDSIVVIQADAEVRIRRVMERDGATRAQVIERMARQMTDDQRRRHAHHTLVNNGDDLLLPSIIRLHKLFLSGKTK